MRGFRAANGAKSFAVRPRNTAVAPGKHYPRIIVLLSKDAKAAMTIGSLPAILAIIAPRAEEQWLSDFVTQRELPLHLAALIALIALFIIAWVALSDGRPAPRRLGVTNSRSATSRPLGH